MSRSIFLSALMLGSGRPSRPDATHPLRLAAVVLPPPRAPSRAAHSRPSRASPSQPSQVRCWWRWYSRGAVGAGAGGAHSDRRTRCSVPPVVRRSLSRAKPSGGRGGARTRPTLLVLVVLARRCSLPALTSTTGIDRRRPPLCCKTYVSSVFKCFIGMLQVFYVDIVKVDRDIAYVAMVVHVCCKLLFPMFHLFSNVCCKCVYLDVVYVSHTCCKCFI
jgi:hypothetical protein